MMLANQLESVIIIGWCLIAQIVCLFSVVVSILFALFCRNFDESEFTFIIKAWNEFACRLEYDAYFCALSGYILFLLTALSTNISIGYLKYRFNTFVNVWSWPEPRCSLKITILSFPKFMYSFSKSKWMKTFSIVVSQLFTLNCQFLPCFWYSFFYTC